MPSSNMHPVCKYAVYVVSALRLIDHCSIWTSQNALVSFFLVFFLVCFAATQLATQIPQICVQVICSNKVARKRLTESKGIPAMDLGHMNAVSKQYYFHVLFYDCCFEIDIRIRRYTNKRRVKHITYEREQFDFESWGGVGYFSNERGFSVESSLQHISSNIL